eukprot:c14259_g1_i1 orf=466-2823(+)
MVATCVDAHRLPQQLCKQSVDQATTFKRWATNESLLRPEINTDWYSSDDEYCTAPSFQRQQGSHISSFVSIPRSGKVSRALLESTRKNCSVKPHVNGYIPWSDYIQTHGEEVVPSSALATRSRTFNESQLLSRIQLPQVDTRTRSVNEPQGHTSIQSFRDSFRSTRSINESHNNYMSHSLTLSEPGDLQYHTEAKEFFGSSGFHKSKSVADLQNKRVGSFFDHNKTPGREENGPDGRAVLAAKSFNDCCTRLNMQSHSFSGLNDLIENSSQKGSKNSSEPTQTRGQVKSCTSVSNYTKDLSAEQTVPDTLLSCRAASQTESQLEHHSHSPTNYPLIQTGPFSIRLGSNGYRKVSRDDHALSYVQRNESQSCFDSDRLSREFERRPVRKFISCSGCSKLSYREQELPKWCQNFSCFENSTDDKRRLSWNSSARHKNSKTATDSGLWNNSLDNPGREHSEEWTIDMSHLFVGHRFACGAYSRLYLGMYKQKAVAIKIMRQPDQRKAVNSVQMDKLFLHEVGLLSRLRHCNIVQFVGAFSKPPIFCVITEYVRGGSLRAFLNKIEPFSLSLNVVVRIALDIARGMAYLHSQGIVHRDLKSQNLLLSHDLQAKVADFGVSCFESQLGKVTGARGTYRWMAPEMVQEKPYSRKVDVYSFGIVLWELLTGLVPFSEMTAVQAAIAVAQKDERPPLWPNCPLSLSKLMQNCWSTDPNKRPEFSEVQKHLEQLHKSIKESSFKHFVNSFRKASTKYFTSSLRKSIAHTPLGSNQNFEMYAAFLQCYNCISTKK